MREFEKLMKEYKEKGIDISEVRNDKRYIELSMRHRIRNM